MKITWILLFTFLSLLNISFQKVRPQLSLDKAVIPSSIDFETATLNYESLAYGTYQFTGPVTLGGSSNTYKMVFDTTASISYVFSSDCVECATSKDVTKQFSCKSPCNYMTDYQDHVSNYTVNGVCSLWDFDISAYKATDSMTISGLSVSAFDIYVVFKSSAGLKYNAQGGLSLGNTDKSIIKYFYDQGKVSQQIFAFYFSGQYNLLTFGYEEPYFGLEDYTEYPVIAGSDAWAVPVYKVYMNDKVNDGLLSGTSRAYLDSTLDGIAMPTAQFQIIYAEISRVLGSCGLSDTQSVTCKCASSNDIDKLPTLGFSFGENSRIYNIKPTNYAYFSNNNCTINVFQDKNQTAWVLGLPIFKSYYLVFDQSEQIIKFASLNSQTAESYVQDDSLRISIIVVGLLIIFISIFMLLLILKPVPVDLERRMEKGE